MKKNKQLRYSVSRPIIGGVPQAILTSKDNRAKPLLLLLHGGPGEPMTPFTDELVDLEERFVVCIWEQRGAGMSYVRQAEDIRIFHYVSDALEVTRYLLERFERDKLVLMGFSWGTLVGILAAAQAPELYLAYLGVGQLADQRASEMEAYEAALEKATQAKDKKSADFLLCNGPPPYSGKNSLQLIIKERTILRKYSDNPAKSPKLAEYFCKIFCCEYYSLTDKINYFRGLQSGVPLFSEIMQFNVQDAVPSVLVPVYVLQGKHDMQTSPRQARKLIDGIDAPRKQFILFERAGHSPMGDDPEAFYQTLDGIMREI